MRQNCRSIYSDWLWKQSRCRGNVHLTIKKPSFHPSIKWLGSLLLSQTLFDLMTDTMWIRYAKLREEQLSWDAITAAARCWNSLSKLLIHPARGCWILLNSREALSTWPWTSHYGALFPKLLLGVWGQTALPAPTLISLTGPQTLLPTA